MKADDLISTPIGYKLLELLLVNSGKAISYIASISEAELYEYVVRCALAVTSEGLPTRVGWFDHAPERRFSEDELLSTAHVLMTAEASRWWADSWSARPQVWLSKSKDPPAPTAVVTPVSEKPRTALWTSSAVQGTPSAWWPVVESGYLGPCRQWDAWNIAISRGARVFEVRSPSDWALLCERYPADRTSEIVRFPDWEDVAKDLDGVHLTVEGLIRTQAVMMNRTGRPTMLWGWDAEGTAWLRWQVESATRLATFASS